MVRWDFRGDELGSAMGEDVPGWSELSSYARKWFTSVEEWSATVS